MLIQVAINGYNNQDSCLRDEAEGPEHLMAVPGMGQPSLVLKELNIYAP